MANGEGDKALFERSTVAATWWMMDYLWIAILRDGEDSSASRMSPMSQREGCKLPSRGLDFLFELVIAVICSSSRLTCCYLTSRGCVEKIARGRPGA